MANPRLRPTKLLQANRIVPDLGHMFDATPIKFHVVGIICCNAVAGGRHRSTGASLGTVEYCNGGDSTSTLIGSEEL